MTNKIINFFIQTLLILIKCRNESFKFLFIFSINSRVINAYYAHYFYYQNLKLNGTLHNVLYFQSVEKTHKNL